MKRPAAQKAAAIVIAAVGALTTSTAVADRGSLVQSVVFAVRVPPIVRWIGHTGDAKASLGLDYDPAHPAANIASETFRLATNIDVTIEAQVTAFTNPSDPQDQLTTTWRITDDRAGDPDRTGVLERDADASQGYGAFVPGSDFVSNGLRVTHRPGDGNVSFMVTARGERENAVRFGHSLSG